MIRRRYKVAVAATAASVACGYLALPALVEWQVRAKLADKGFPDARLAVANIGLNHLDLEHVQLQPGLDLGNVHLDRGLSLLWRDVHDVAIEGANVALDQVAAHPPHFGISAGTLPFRALHIAGSTISLGDNVGALVGSITADHGALDVTIEVTEPKGFSARATGRVAWGSGVTVTGHVDVDVPKVDAGPYALTNLQIPATLDAEGIHVRNAHANLGGGTLRLDGFAPTNGTPDLVLYANGVRLVDLLAPTKRVTGTGVIDGEIALHVDTRGLWVRKGQLHARAGGTLQVTDAALRKKVAAINPASVQSKLGSALTDFKYDTLTAELSAPGDGPELRVSTRGRGRTNSQELDIAIGFRGVRDVAADLLKGRP